MWPRPPERFCVFCENCLSGPALRADHARVRIRHYCIFVLGAILNHVLDVFGQASQFDGDSRDQ